MGRMIGYIMSEETKRKIGQANARALKGRKLSEEHKANVSKGNKGKIVSESSRKKMSAAKTKQHRDPVFREKFMRGQKKRHENANNKLEQKLLKHLTECGIAHEFQKIIENKYLVDFYLPEENLIVEVDGAIHFYAERIARDKKRDTFFRKHGFDVAHIGHDGLFHISMLVKKIKKIGKVG